MQAVDRFNEAAMNSSRKFEVAGAKTMSKGFNEAAMNSSRNRSRLAEQVKRLTLQ